MDHVVAEHGVSERFACRVLGQDANRPLGSSSTASAVRGIANLRKRAACGLAKVLICTTAGAVGKLFRISTELFGRSGEKDFRLGSIYRRLTWERLWGIA